MYARFLEPSIMYQNTHLIQGQPSPLLHQHDAQQAPGDKDTTSVVSDFHYCQCTTTVINFGLVAIFQNAQSQNDPVQEETIDQPVPDP